MFQKENVPKKVNKKKAKQKQNKTKINSEIPAIVNNISPNSVSSSACIAKPEESGGKNSNQAEMSNLTGLESNSLKRKQETNNDISRDNKKLKTFKLIIQDQGECFEYSDSDYD